MCQQAIFVNYFTEWRSLSLLNVSIVAFFYNPFLRVSSLLYTRCTNAHKRRRWRLTSFHHVPSVPSCTFGQRCTVQARNIQVIRSRNRPSLFPVYRNHGWTARCSRVWWLGRFGILVAGWTRRVKICRFPTPRKYPPGTNLRSRQDAPFPPSPLLPRSVSSSRTVFANFPMRSSLRTYPDFTPAATYHLSIDQGERVCARSSRRYFGRKKRISS